MLSARSPVPGPSAAWSSSTWRTAASSRGSVAAEWEVGAEIRRTRALYGTVSGLSFDRLDVDHVVLAPSGVYAVEVTSLWSRQVALEDVLGLSRMLDRARREARKVGLLLGSVPAVADVLPVLVLAGPGAPDLRAPMTVEGVWILCFRWTQGRWAELLDAPWRRLDHASAEAAAAVLQDYARSRHAHRLTDPDGTRAT